MSDIKTLDKLISNKDCLDDNRERARIDFNYDTQKTNFVPFKTLKRWFGKKSQVPVSDIIKKYQFIKFDKSLNNKYWVPEELLSYRPFDLHLIKKILKKKPKYSYESTKIPFNEFLVIMNVTTDSIILMHTKVVLYWKLSLINLANNTKKVFIKTKPWFTEKDWFRFIDLYDTSNLILKGKRLLDLKDLYLKKNSKQKFKNSLKKNIKLTEVFFLESGRWKNRLICLGLREKEAMKSFEKKSGVNETDNIEFDVICEEMNKILQKKLDLIK